MISARPRNRKIAASPLVRLPLRSVGFARTLVANSALTGNKVAPTMPKPFKKERRPTSRRLRQSNSTSAEGTVMVSLDVLRPLFRTFFIIFSGVFQIIALSS